MSQVGTRGAEGRVQVKAHLMAPLLVQGAGWGSATPNLGFT